jgi:dipeptidyl aminopeptidase/acylaminoacyl peptidase
LTVLGDYQRGGRNPMVRRSLAEEFGPRARYDEISPRQQAARADAPILLIHGREDTVVPFRQSEVMADALKDHGKPFELVDLQAEDHWLTRSKTRQKMLAAALAFVLEHNPPDMPGSSAGLAEPLEQ